MPLIYNGTTVKKVVYNSTTLTKLIYNGVTVFTSEESITPTWTYADSWSVQTWGSWVLSHDGSGNDTWTGTATSNAITTNGHRYLRITPDTEWIAHGVGSIKIFINDNAYDGQDGYALYNDGNQGGDVTRSNYLDIDISAYNSITVKIVLSCTYESSYVNMPCETQLLLHD